MFALSTEPLDSRDLKHDLGLTTPASGGYAAFEGWVRDHNEGRRVRQLEYEAYAAMAEKEGRRIVAEAIERFAVDRAACIHRVGRLAIGDMAVWVGVSAAHRDDAFKACRFIIDEVKARVPIWKKEYYTDGDSGWVNCEACAAHGHGHVHNAPSVSTLLTEADYYARQMVLPEIGPSGQRRLGDARVLVIGAGGLGCAALPYLAAAGIGTLGICDHDRLDASNLHRQILYAAHDVGQPKGELAAQSLRRQNPFINVTVHPERLTAANAAALFAQYDVVLDCTDNFETKYIINDTALQTGTVAVIASIYQYEGQLLVVDPAGAGGCLRCLWPEPPAPGCIGSCAEAGVLGAIPGLFGTLQAIEVLKRALELPAPAQQKLVLLDALTLTITRIPVPKLPACPACGTRPAVKPSPPIEPTELDALELGALPGGDFGAYRLVDIREDRERQAAPLPFDVDALALPASTFPDTLPNGETYILVCSRGVRSRYLAWRLQREGLRAYSLRGGVETLGNALQNP